ncbi:hypothetical protein BO71DRAFT_401476 [Aspergillus ellipticus CBS 707.79]|uniref:Uncharacterized protein n=1 Tax=Aspergillus ellipticus CBS 707.79 TaxID=1448320 RepID=A0A319D2L1_9EURO|nr:hypothetical protein BO71DRAFT_401476 [Aspergillus ellipticus CBS 707.79]
MGLLKLKPPYTRENQLCASPIHLPAYLPDLDLRPRSQVTEDLEHDLHTHRLDRMSSHLWLAGLPKAARPLHRQTRLNRQIIVTETPTEHLVWHETRIFVKPLPEYLLSHDFWSTLSADRTLHASACGLLLSYCWLICTKSDLSIAHSAQLIPAHITWESWTSFAADFVAHIDTQSLQDVSPRYHFGELRLSRLKPDPPPVPAPIHPVGDDHRAVHVAVHVVPGVLRAQLRLAAPGVRILEHHPERDAGRPGGPRGSRRAPTSRWRRLCSRPPAWWPSPPASPRSC